MVIRDISIIAISLECIKMSAFIYASCHLRLMNDKYIIM